MGIVSWLVRGINDFVDWENNYKRRVGRVEQRKVVWDY